MSFIIMGSDYTKPLNKMFHLVLHSNLPIHTSGIHIL